MGVLKREIKEQWVEALRSGRYKQGLHALRDGDRFCCLGVLCDIVNPDWRLAEDPDRPLRYITGVAETNYPPEWVWRQVLVDARDLVYVGTVAQKLANMNDTSATFDFIADEIERTL